MARACSLEAAALAGAGMAGAYTLASLEPNARAHGQRRALLERLAVRVAADWLPPTR